MFRGHFRAEAGAELAPGTGKEVISEEGRGAHQVVTPPAIERETLTIRSILGPVYANFPRVAGPPPSTP
jgi:hypothetical protein